MLAWLVRAILFGGLLAFSLNNQHATIVHGFFGYDWSAPMAIVLLAAFAGGMFAGVLALTPSWWQLWRRARKATAAPAPAPAPVAPVQPTAPVTPIDGI